VQGLLRKDRISTSVGLVLGLLLAQKVVALARGVIFARLLGTEKYGIYTLGYFLIMITVSFATLGIPSCFGRFVPRYESRKAVRWFLRRTYFLNIVVSGAVALVILARPSLFSELIYDDRSYGAVVVIAALCIPAFVIIRNLISTFAALRLFRASSLLEFSQVVAFAAIGIVLVTIHPSAAGALSAYALSMLVVGLIFLPMLVRYLGDAEPTYSRQDEKGFYGHLLRFTLWLTLTPVLVQVFAYVDRLSLQRLMTASDQGIYSAMVNITATLSAIGLAVNSVIYPNLSKIWEAGDRGRALGNLDLAVRFTSVALTVTGLILLLLARPVVGLLLGQEYLPGVGVMPYLVVFYLLTISVWLFGIFPTLVERTYVSAVGLGFALPVNVALNLVLIPRLGLSGAALATMLAYLLMWAIVVVICKRFGLPVGARTVLVALLPLVLLTPRVAAAAAVCVIVIASFRGSRIFTSSERQRVHSELAALLARLRRPAPGR
jgi:O-antigen/teichoic acid export membrane protein